MDFQSVNKLLLIIYCSFLGRIKGFKSNGSEYNENDLLNKLFGKKTYWEKQAAYLTEKDINDLNLPECPEQVHLSLGNATSEIVVMWATKQSLATDPIVQYGTDASSMASEKGTSVYFYFTSQNTISAKVHYHAVLKDLFPDTTYYYQIVSGKCRSHLLSFTTLPSGEDWSSSYLVYGDMGRLHKSPIMQQLRFEVRHHRYHAIFHVGDFAYDMDTLNGAMGDAFMKQIQEIASKIPYMTCPGNHEMSASLLHYVHRFSMPGSSWPMKPSRMWYSMNLANVHFISYSTEVYFFTCNENKEKIDQYIWLENDLQEANHPLNRSIRPWIIAFGHRPMYCSNSDFDDCTYNTSKVRLGLEDLFFKYGIDVIIQAHEHSYERLWPLYNNKLWGKNYTNPGAPVHLISGAAGCNEHFGICVDPIIKSRGEWSAFHTWLPGLYSYGRLKIYNNTHLQWQQVLGVNGQVIDELWLIQENHGSFLKWWNSELDISKIESSVSVENVIKPFYCWPNQK